MSKSRQMRGTAREVAYTLALQPHPEGGYFRETYRSSQSLQTARGERSLATAILFLVAGGRPSRFHRLQADELWVHQAGAPLEILVIEPPPAGGNASGRLHRHVLGAAGSAVAPHADVPAMLAPQALVSAGTWQAARLIGPAAGLDDWALVTCVVAPGFDYQDFELADRDTLMAEHPHLRGTIIELT